MSSLNRVTLLLQALLFFFQSTGQNNDSLIRHPGRYRVDLPKELMRPKLIQAITDILPQTIAELKDREFCTSGIASYYVRLLIDSLVVTNQQTSPPVEIGSIPHYTFTFDYSFYAALIVSDSLEKPFSMLQLVSGDETMNYSKQFSLRPQNVIYSYITIYDPRGRAVGRRVMEEARAVNNYVPKISAYSVITEDFLLNICEQKIFEIRKLLKKINVD
jgi:hypothetical protein